MGKYFQKSQVNWPAVALIAPAIITLLAVVAYPLIFLLTVSFRQYELTQIYLGTPFVGLQNYRTVLTDGLFWDALGRTALFFAITVPVQLSLGISVALLLKRTRWQRWAAVLRTALVLPIAVTPAVLGLVGRLVYNRDFGILNYLLGLVGIDKVSWLGQPVPAFISIALTETWQWTPFVVLIMLASLTTVPQNIIDAARLDTNNNWQIFRYVQLPFLLPGITFVLIIRTADTLKLFDMVWTLTRGGPGVSTELISLYVQRIGFRVFDVGVASAQAVLLLILCIVLSQAYIRFVYREVEA
jgi:multiple sugar transport system permease protein